MVRASPASYHTRKGISSDNITQMSANVVTRAQSIRRPCGNKG
jgi:hypothetical protein